MPVTRCDTCHRGLAGYLDGEKELSDLTAAEIVTEISKYKAKEFRIREYLDQLKKGVVAPQDYPQGALCYECGQGWREFQDHRKDLEQLTLQEAIAALGSNTNWLNRLRGKLGSVGAATVSASA